MDTVWKNCCFELMGYSHLRPDYALSLPLCRIPQDNFLCAWGHELQTFVYGSDAYHIFTLRKRHGPPDCISSPSRASQHFAMRIVDAAMPAA